MVGFEMTNSRETLHPGRILLTQAMEPLGISRNQLARDIDVPVGRISDITNGKRGVTADTALRLGRYFGTGPELWLRLQAEFDLYVASTTTWPAVESRVRVLKSETPVAAPVKLPVAALVETPVYEASSADEASIEDEVLAGPDLEPVAEIFGDETGSDSDGSPDSGIRTAEQLAQPVDPSETEVSAETPNNNEEPTDLPQSVTVDPGAGDGFLKPGFDPGSADDPEEDLGIPPVPDKSNLFMSG